MATSIVTGTLIMVGGAWYHFHAATDLPSISFVSASRGDITQSVACTGTLGAATTVDVGSQVSGTILDLPVDFNSVVHKGEVLARLDPSLLQAKVDQAQSELAVATANVETGRVAVIDATEKVDRARALVAKQLIPQSDEDDAEVALREAQAALRQDEGAVEAAKGALDQARVDLEHAVITSPVDGVVIDRKVDKGQTVAASFQAPSLFSVATDLTRLQLQATVDESDIGRVHTGMPARFSVDAYGSREFSGTVTQVRLEPTVVQNVVSYTVIVTVDNADLLLRPGMTATIAIDGVRHSNVLRIPSTALLFRPTSAVLQALNESSMAKASARVPATVLPGASVQVWVVSQGRLEPRTVKVGLSDARYTEVLEGLSEGAEVALSAFAPSSAQRLAAPPSPLSPRMWRPR